MLRQCFISVRRPAPRSVPRRRSRNTRPRFLINYWEGWSCIEPSIRPTLVSIAVFPQNVNQVQIPTDKMPPTMGQVQGGSLEQFVQRRPLWKFSQNLSILWCKCPLLYLHSTHLDISIYNIYTSIDIDTNLQYLQLADDPVVVIIIVITAPAEAHNGTAAQKPDNNNRNSSNNNCAGDEEQGDVRDEYEACAGCGHLMLCCCHQKQQHTANISSIISLFPRPGQDRAGVHIIMRWQSLPAAKTTESKL